MHLMLMTRGIYRSHEDWKSFMQSQWFIFRQKPILKYENDVFEETKTEKGNQTIIEKGKLLHKKGEFIKNPDGTYQYGKETPIRVQGSLRPIQLWEYIFPQESLQEVLAMQGCHKNYNELRPEVNKFAWVLRKMMGAKKIPDMPELKKKEIWEVTNKIIPTPGFAVYPIGIREDRIGDFIFGDVGYYQEGI